MSSQVGLPPEGQFVLGGAEYRAAKACSRLSLSGSPPAPSFQAHWLTLSGSLEPPPTKRLAFRLSSATQEVATAPVVSPGFGLVHWSGIAFGGLGSSVTVTW